MQDKTSAQSTHKLRKFLFSRNFLIFLMPILIFSIPRLILAVYESRGYTFKENSGYISQYAYAKYSQNFDVIFDKEVFIYVSNVSIDDVYYITYFSSNEIFDIAIPPDRFAGLSNLYEFEFLYGEPFRNSNEVVISESISMDLFNKTNSLDETITINDTEFVITGVVKELEDSMNYIYLSDEVFETLINREFLLFDFVMFQDQELFMKLYEKGGIEFISRTTTINNQSTLNFASGIIINLIGIAFSFIFIYKAADKPKPKAKEKLKNEKFIYFIIRSYIIITLYLMYLILIYILLFARHTTIKVSTIYVFDLIAENIWILSIYLIPILFYAFDKLRKNKKTDIPLDAL